MHALFELVRASELFVAVTFDSADRVSTDGDSQAALQRLAQMLSVRPTDLTRHLNDAVAPRVAQTVSTTPDSPRSRAVKSSIAKTLYDGVFEDLPKLEPGDRLRIECTYNNSESNVMLKEWLGGPVTEGVRLGKDTHQEMCIVAVGFACDGLCQ